MWVPGSHTVSEKKIEILEIEAKSKKLSTCPSFHITSDLFGKKEFLSRQQ